MRMSQLPPSWARRAKATIALDAVRDILAGDRAVRDCGSAPEQGAGRVDRCREVDDEAREPSIERLT
jgi:hypothetical protein